MCGIYRIPTEIGRSDVTDGQTPTHAVCYIISAYTNKIHVFANYSSILLARYVAPTVSTREDGGGGK